MQCPFTNQRRWAENQRRWAQPVNTPSNARQMPVTISLETSDPLDSLSSPSAAVSLAPMTSPVSTL
jgi:hypothetical protein